MHDDTQLAARKNIAAENHRKGQYDANHSKHGFTYFPVALMAPM